MLTVTRWLHIRSDISGHHKDVNQPHITLKVVVDSDCSKEQYSDHSSLWFRWCNYSRAHVQSSIFQRGSSTWTRISRNNEGWVRIYNGHLGRLSKCEAIEVDNLCRSLLCSHFRPWFSCKGFLCQTILVKMFTNLKPRSSLMFAEWIIK